MMSRILFLRTLAASLLALSVLPLLAQDDKAKEATVIKAGAGKITLTFKGVDGKHNHDVAKDAKITLDEKVAKLEELKEGFLAHVTIDAKFVVTKIHAESKKNTAKEATVIKAGDGKITLTFKGVDGKHNHDVAKDAKITLDEKVAKLEELKEGFPAKVTIDAKFVVTKIDAKRK